MSDFVELDWAGRQVRIEYRWTAAAGADATPLVFMHEGLGSVSMWRDFPDQLCAATGCRGLVFSRPGYGRSTAREPGERWGADFMHRQAHEMLPALFAAVGLDPVATPPWLFGHSDGGSIALLHAAQESRAGSLARVVRVAGAIVVAPHIFVEEVAITSIEAARQAYLEGGLRQALSRHHDDPDSAFWGWNDAWLAPSFRGWSIESELAAITCPLLAVQGLDDEYGSLAQIRGIAQRLPHTHLLELAECGHSPHRDQPGRLIAGVANFMAA